jgi:probable F420-dependent oxidoreductase
MKIRVGLGLGALRPQDDAGEIVDALEDSGVDSLWFSEILDAPLVDPVVGMAYVAGRTRRLKVGTGVMVMPGRHPVSIAKQLASLARLAPKRVLPVFGLQPARAPERMLFAAQPGQRGALFDETLQLTRLLLEQPRVTFEGDFFSIAGVGTGFVPDPPLDLWLGGTAPAALRRIGKLADGWLASFVTPAQAGIAIQTIRDAASDAGRSVDDEHYGISLAVAFGEIPARLVAAARERTPEVDPADLVAQGWDGAARMIEQYADVGMSKFVLRPALPPPSWEQFVDDFVRHIAPVQ